MTATPAQDAALRTLVDAGTVKEAAARLGITPRCLRQRLDRLRHRNGMTLPQLAYWLDRESQAA